MRNHVYHVTTALLVASVAFACSGGPEESREKANADKRGTNERISVEGCLQAPRSSGGEYVLEVLRVPQPEEQPQGHESIDPGLRVTVGSWVLLTGADDLKRYLGKRVSVWGEIKDRGENTLGTTGRVMPQKEAQTQHQKFEQAAKDAHTDADRAKPPSTVPPVGALANGLAPTIAVEKVNQLADACEAGSAGGSQPNK
jgi:hypothetical protein